jgi:hypothetical protein
LHQGYINSGFWIGDFGLLIPKFAGLPAIESVALFSGIDISRSASRKESQRNHIAKESHRQCEPPELKGLLNPALLIPLYFSRPGAGSGS